MKKRNAKGGILLMAGGVLLLILALTQEGWSTLPVSFSMGTKEIRMEESADAASTGRIAIHSGSTDVRVIPAASDKIHARLMGKASPDYADQLKLEVKPQNGTLQIGVVEPDSIHIGINLTELELIVELPPKDWESLSIRTQSGDLKLDDLKGSEVAAEASSGDIEARRIEAAGFKLRTTSGNIRSEEFKGQELTFQAESGDVILVRGHSALKGSTGSGSITVETEEILHPADLSAGSGDVTVQSDRRPPSLHLDYRSSSGSGSILWDGFVYVDQSEDGERISGAFGAGEIPLKVRTSSGSFTLQD
ncbi:hypothetical protein PM3016_4906 [Paenibacillus mucilaginosus 3016]|uniref:DUF4097 domain-containing protein n=1 Tax=Paenibacillus mucilaginosus 3016 TaxID=1116391 RepID=H6NLS3_9BACL|nr:DUF4097 family beta strand repeat-containing protein [Paenibacillus mucilaginosus]AFC31638.1 hypothetical protein PM3016_4906 [Paenibacillus mucilaginosus 3016]WFA20171.1 hypothetical protein ERY13_24495 [Paenibacillus mucilaginosus]